jgi:hypothetical protein
MLERMILLTIVVVLPDPAPATSTIGFEMSDSARSRDR